MPARRTTVAQKRPQYFLADLVAIIALGGLVLALVRSFGQPRNPVGIFFLIWVGRHRLAHVQRSARATYLRGMRAAFRAAKKEAFASSLPSMRSASARPRPVAEGAGHRLLGFACPRRDRRGPHAIPDHGFGRFPASLDILDCSVSHRLAPPAHAALGAIHRPSRRAVLGGFGATQSRSVREMRDPCPTCGHDRASDLPSMPSGAPPQGAITEGASQGRPGDSRSVVDVVILAGFMLPDSVSSHLGVSYWVALPLVVVAAMVGLPAVFFVAAVLVVVLIYVVRARRLKASPISSQGPGRLPAKTVRW